MLGDDKRKAMVEKMNGYELSRNWFDFAFENPEKISPNHAAIYFFAIEHCNRLGWKRKFGFPTQMAMDALGIKKHQTYIRYFNDLCEWGFFDLIQKSQNQYSANIISLVSDKPKNGKALDKAMRNHTAKQTETNGQSNSPIDKPITSKPITTKQEDKVLLSEIKISDVPIKELDYYNAAIAFQKLFHENIKTVGGSLKHIDGAKYKEWVNPIRLMVESDKVDKDGLVKVYNFLKVNDFWKSNVQSTKKLREKFNTIILQANEKGKSKQSGLSKEFIERIYNRG